MIAASMPGGVSLPRVPDMSAQELIAAAPRQVSAWTRGISYPAGTVSFHDQQMWVARKDAMRGAKPGRHSAWSKAPQFIVRSSYADIFVDPATGYVLYLDYETMGGRDEWNDVVMFDPACLNDENGEDDCLNLTFLTRAGHWIWGAG